MRLLFLTLTLLLAPLAASAQTLGDAPPVYVATAYDKLANNGGFNPPDSLYTPRLRALQALDRREAGGEVGRVDFFPWTNSQDGTLSDLSIASAFVDGREDRMIVTVNFKNEGRPERVHFYWIKSGGKWLIDDISSDLGEPWTLSLVYKYGWAMRD